MTLAIIKDVYSLKSTLVMDLVLMTTAANLAMTQSRMCLAPNAYTKYLTGQDQVTTNTSELTI